MRKWVVAGGDGRMLALAKLLKKDGDEVQTIGLLPQEQADTSGADVILLPYPFSVRNGQIPCLTGAGIDPQELLKKAGKETLIIAEKGMETYGFFLRYTQAPGFEQRNAEISAEAAVYEVMERSGKALMDLCVLVTGYGLFAKALAQKLRSLGAEVWIAARRIEARRQAQEDGMQTVSIREMGSILGKVDVLLNTVPAQIITEADLRRLPSRAWLMELASAPYGFDRDVAQALGLKSALLPGLPARYAPESAALALHDAVISLTEEAER